MHRSRSRDGFPVKKGSTAVNHRFPRVVLIAALVGSTVLVPAWSQQKQRKPPRAEAPKFSGSEFPGTFYSDVQSVLQGQRPAVQSVMASAASAGGSSTGGSAAVASPDMPVADPYAWGKTISAATLEDAVKDSKLRLDGILVSLPKFKGGGNKAARREFSLQAMLFAIIEQYPGDVRWKRSAAAARERFARVAANCKTNTESVYAECKQRLQDLTDLLGGSTLESPSSAELNWSQIIDRGPLMELLEWSHQEHLLTFTANATQFEQNKEELQQFAELVAVLSKMAIMEDMPDAGDQEYRQLALQMAEYAGQIRVAVQTGSADLAREAAGQVGQSCVKCHDSYK
jgi:hypothetical protein